MPISDLLRQNMHTHTHAQNCVQIKCLFPFSLSLSLSLSYTHTHTLTHTNAHTSPSTIMNKPYCVYESYTTPTSLSNPLPLFAAARVKTLINVMASCSSCQQLVGASQPARLHWSLVLAALSPQPPSLENRGPSFIFSPSRRHLEAASTTTTITITTTAQPP